MTEKQREIIIKSLTWFIGLFIIIFIGVNNVFAQTYTLDYNSFVSTADTYSQYIQCNNNQCILYDVPFYNYPMNFEWGTTNSPTCNNTAVVSGTLYLDNTNFGMTNRDYNWNQVFLVNDNQYYNCTFNVGDNGTSYVCTTPKLSSNFKIGFTLNNNFGTQTSFNSVISRQVDINCDTSTGQIIDNQTNNTQNIINNNNTNTQEIINNQNSNTQQQIESQKVCTEETIDKSYGLINNNYLNSSGQQVYNAEYTITDYIVINFLYITENFGNTYNCFYTEDKILISCINANTTPLGNYSLPVGTYYARFSINKVANRPQYKVGSCKNGNQAISDDNKEAEKTRKGILGKIKDLFDTLFSNDDADISGLDNMVGWLPAGPVDSIINLPLALFNSLTNTLSGTCTSVTLTLPFVNQQLTLPCFDSYMSEHLNGFSTLWTWVGITVSVFILYNYLLSLYKWIDDTLTMRENNLPGYYDDNMWGGA